MLGTGFGFQSDCSAYNLSTNIKNDMNDENLRNFLERFSQFNPEAQPPHMFETKSLYSDTRGCDPNHNYKCQPSDNSKIQPPPLPIPVLNCATPNPDSRPQCTGNISISYNISYSPTSGPCQCQCARQNSRLHSAFITEGSVNYNCREKSLFCDV